MDKNISNAQALDDNAMENVLGGSNPLDDATRCPMFAPIKPTADVCYMCHHWDGTKDRGSCEIPAWDRALG